MTDINLTPMRYDPDNSKFVGNNVINDIAEDGYGNIWIATKSGLNKLERSSGRITRFLHKEINPASIANDVINKLASTRKAIPQRIATQNGGLDPHPE